MKLYILILCSAFYNTAYTQSFCGTTFDINAKEKILRLSEYDSRSYGGETPIVRLALHRITRDNGLDGFTWAEIHDWMSTLPDAYQPHDICFSVVSEDEIHNNAFFPKRILIPPHGKL